MADIFLSYSREDAGFARRLVDALQAEGFSVWWDHEIPPGRTWDEYIGRALHEAKVVLVLWSKTAVASNWVKEEASVAERSGKFSALSVDGTEPPLGFTRYQAGSFKDFNWNRNDRQWRLLADDLRARIAGTAPAQTPPPRPRPAKSAGAGGGLASILIGIAVLGGLGGAGWYFWDKAQAVGRPEGGPVRQAPGPVITTEPAALDPAAIVGEWRGQMFFPGETAEMSFTFAADGTFHAVAGHQGRGSYDGRWEIAGQELRWGCASGGSVCYAATPENGVLAGTATTDTNAEWRVDFRFTKTP